MFVFMWYLMIKHAIIMHLFGSKFSDTIEIQFKVRPHMNNHFMKHQNFDPSKNKCYSKHNLDHIKCYFDE